MYETSANSKLTKTAKNIYFVFKARIDIKGSSNKLFIEQVFQSSISVSFAVACIIYIAKQNELPAFTM